MYQKNRNQKRKKIIQKRSGLRRGIIRRRGRKGHRRGRRGEEGREVDPEEESLQDVEEEDKKIE